MSNTAKQLKATARSVSGKGAARSVRREGRVPAVIYGGSGKWAKYPGNKCIALYHAIE
jgi:ribosomal protein L25 (general stress protein Ctc)